MKRRKAFAGKTKLAGKKVLKGWFFCRRLHADLADPIHFFTASQLIFSGK